MGTPRTRLPPHLLLVPTTACELDCDHCFVPRETMTMDLDLLRRAVRQYARLAGARSVRRVTISWRGGEVLALGQGWLREAGRLVAEELGAAGVEADQHLQTNLVAYDPSWDELLREIFGHRVGTSHDFPNLRRRRPGGEPGELEELWLSRYRKLRSAGFRGSVVALVNEASVAPGGARALLDFFFGTAGVRDLQVELPFPSAARGAPLDPVRRLRDDGSLASFMVELYDEWCARYRGRDRHLRPYRALERYSATGGAQPLPCIWSRDCGGQVVAVGPDGVVGPCDRFVVAHPDRCYGTIDEGGLAGALGSTRRERLAWRAERLSRARCGTCPDQQVCFGGCPVRARAWLGSDEQPDPYCEVYQRIFVAVRRRRSRIR